MADYEPDQETQTASGDTPYDVSSEADWDVSISSAQLFNAPVLDSIRTSD